MVKRVFSSAYSRFALAAAGIVVLYLALTGWEASASALSDGLAVAALAFLMLGAWRFVLRQGTFASTKFGFLKLKELLAKRDYRASESQLSDMGEYVQKYRYDKPVLPPLLSAAAAAVLSIALWSFV